MTEVVSPMGAAPLLVLGRVSEGDGQPVGRGGGEGMQGTPCGSWSLWEFEERTPCHQSTMELE